MLRYTAAILLLIAFSAHTFQGTFIVFDYYTNTESFARQCINKLRPSLNCNGQCLLMKKLKEKEKQGQHGPERKLETKADYAFTRSTFVFKTTQITIRSFFHDRSENVLPGHCGKIFHPPSIA